LVSGPERDRNLLKAVVALLNSELAQYYFFLTSASWGVEREEIKAGEMKTIPFPFSTLNEEQIATIAHFVDRLARLVIIPHDLREEEELERELNNYIYKCFLLNEQEIQHIRETIEYTIKFFNSPEKSLALQKPVAEMRISYAQAYIKSINFYLQAVDRKLTGIVYAEEVIPLLTVEFSLNMQGANIPVIQEAEPDEDMHLVLKNLDELSIETLPRRIYHRRNFRVYSDEGTTLYVVKPAERRLWTIGAALSDAEETIADLM